MLTAMAVVTMLMVSINSSAQSKITTVADKGTSGIYVATLCPTTDIAIEEEDEELFVFSVYVDRGTGRAYLLTLVTQDGKYIVKAGDRVIIKTYEPKTIALENTTVKESGVLRNHAICLKEDTPVEDFKTSKPVKEGEYIYMLTNMEANGGFGFTLFTGDTMRKGNFFIVSKKEPETTAVSMAARTSEMPSLTNDITVYDTKGQQVASTREGQVYIQNGKKIVATPENTAKAIVSKQETSNRVKTRSSIDIEDGDPIPFLPGEAGNDDGFTVETTAIVPGDANSDGEVNTSDLTVIADQILGKHPVPFFFTAADVNGDSQINVADIVGTVNIITAQTK